MSTLQQILSKLTNSKSNFFNEYPIKSMAIFGSYSRETNNPNSDVDILIEFKDKIGLRFIDLADELEDLIGIKVDLVSKNGVKESYLQTIDSDLIYV